jgi:hypothetical protein
VLLAQVFSGAIPQFFYELSSQVFMSDANLSKWDFKLAEHNNYKFSFVTPNLSESFYVGE